MLAERQSGGPVPLCGLLEHPQPFREPAGLHSYPGTALDDDRGQGRPDVHCCWQRLIQPTQGLAVPALLGLDQGQVVR